MHFANLITLQQSLGKKSNLIFKVSSTKRQIDIPLLTHMEHKGLRRDGKTFAMCYTIALNFEMNLMPTLFCYISQVIGQ